MQSAANDIIISKAGFILARRDAGFVSWENRLTTNFCNFCVAERVVFYIFRRMEKLTPSQALNRMKHFCAYQERCHKEVKEKLYAYGLDRNAVENIVSQLIAEDYLNEERFAKQFAGGKFRMKQWGKQKIETALRSKLVSEYCIRKALAEIEEDDYKNTFFRLAEKKRKSLNGERNIFIRKRKIRDFLLSKGYTNDIIYPYLAEV